MSRNIPGIHSYCDRWCERCAFTARCAVFEMNAALPEEVNDLASGAWIPVLEQRLSDTLTMLKEERARWKLPEPGEAEIREAAAQKAALRARVKADPLMNEAQDYANVLQDFFRMGDIWKEKTDRLRSETAMGLKTIAAGMEEIDLVEDCFSVLSWYQFFIGAKCDRALQGLWSGRSEPADLQGDANGSAKVALMAVARSRIALRSLFRLLDQHDAVLDLLGRLDRIERLIREHFPEADAFRRPGFDE